MLRTQQAVTWKKRRQLATHVCKLRKIARMMKKRKFLSVRLASPKCRSRRTAMRVRKESQKESLQLPPACREQPAPSATGFHKVQIVDDSDSEEEEESVSRISATVQSTTPAPEVCDAAEGFDFDDMD